MISNVKKIVAFLLYLGLACEVAAQTTPGSNPADPNQAYRIAVSANNQPFAFYKVAVNSKGNVYGLAGDKKDQLKAQSQNGQSLFSISGEFEEGADLVATEQSVYVLDQKEKLVFRFDANTGKLQNRFGDQTDEKFRKPASLGLIQGQLLVFDEGKNNVHFFDLEGKFIKTVLLNGVQSPAALLTNQRDAFYVLDDKLNAILKFDANVKPSASGYLRLGTTRPEKIQCFTVDPLGYLLIQNNTTKQIESYDWKEKPVKITQLGGNLETMTIDPSTYRLIGKESNGRQATYEIKVTPPTPENIYGFDVDNTRLLVTFKPLAANLADRYGLLTYASDGSDSLAYVTFGNQFVIDETSIYKNKSRRYKLVSLNPSAMSAPTTGFDNFFGLGNYLKKAGNYEDAMLAFQNAIRYMGRPQKMVSFVALSMLEMGKAQLAGSPELIKGLNMLKSAYNLNPRSPAIQEGLAAGYQTLFWKLAAQENYTTILEEAGKVISQTFLKPHILAGVDSVAGVLENLPNINTLTNARLMRLKLIEWAPDVAHYHAGAYQTGLRLYELKLRSGAPEYELQALLAESERNIKKTIDLLISNKKPFQQEYLQHLQVLQLSNRYADLEKRAKESITVYGTRFSSEQTIAIREYLANALKGLNRYNDAIAEYEFLLGQKPNDAGYLTGLAETQLLAGNHSEALALYKQLLVNDRSNPLFIGKVGMIELLLGNFTEASFQLEKAVQMDPSNISFYGPLGEAFEKTSNNQKALENYKLAIQYYETGKPNLEQAREKLQYYRNKTAALYSRMSEHALAVEVYKKLANQNPDNAGSWYNLGTASISAGLVFDAVNALQTAQGLDPSDAKIKTALQNAIDLRNQVSANEDPLTIAEFNIPEIYPSLYINYADLNLLPIGEIIVANNTKLPLKCNSMTLDIPGLMAQPTVQNESILVGFSNSTLNLRAIFSSAILKQTQSQTLQATVSINYTYENRPRTAKKTIPVTVHSRNAINWADKRKLASFISQGSGPVTDFSRKVSEYFGLVPSNSLNDNLASALKLYSALGALKLAYQPDPELSYSTVSINTNLLDFLQYPSETLVRKTGDCDDLVTLYCALLENSGVSTAYIDVPGHIFMALDLKLSPDEALEEGFQTTDIIIYQGKTWLPVETTLIGSGPFSQAWEKGASRYYQEISKGNFPEIVPLVDARKVYRPSDFAPETLPSLPRDQQPVIREFTQQMQWVFQKLNATSLTVIKNQYLNEPNNVYIKNKLAVMLAQTGQWDEARRILEEALRLSPENPSVYNNLGNIAFQQNQYREAIQFYEKSFTFDETDIQTLINLAKANVVILDKAAARKWFDRAASINPGIAKHYSLLLNQIK